MEIKVLRLDKCLKKLGSLKGIDVTPVITYGVVEIALSAKRNLYPGHGVKTGLLRSSIFFEVNSKEQEGKVYTNVEYAPFVEFGTSRAREIPFMRPAFDSNKKKIKDALKTYIKVFIKKNGK